MIQFLSWIKEDGPGLNWYITLKKKNNHTVTLISLFLLSGGWKLGVNSRERVKYIRRLSAIGLTLKQGAGGHILTWHVALLIYSLGVEGPAFPSL